MKNQNKIKNKKKHEREDQSRILNQKNKNKNASERQIKNQVKDRMGGQRKDQKRGHQNGVQIVEVGLRDGLQNEKFFFPLKHRLTLVKKLVQSGLRCIELGAFVSPRWVPQMAATEDLVKLVYGDLFLKKKMSHLEFSVLVPNGFGLKKAISTPLKEISFVVSTTETFSKKNVNCSIDESLKRLKEIIKDSKKRKIKVRSYLSTAFRCPYEGRVREQKVVSMVRKLLSLGVYEVSIGDTIGAATPLQVISLIKKLKDSNVDLSQLAMHFHDTRGMALANVYVSFEHGIRKFDSSIGGLGGCPFAKVRIGNLATEDLVYALKGMGVSTHVNLEALVEAHGWLEKIIKRKLPSHIGKIKYSFKKRVF